MQNPNNGCNSTSNTSYARFTLRNTSYHIYYDFPDPGIPSIATITSVSCSVKGYVSNTSTYPSLQLYSGTSSKGNAITITSSSSTNVSSITNTGSWSVNDTKNARLYIAVSTSSNSNRYFYFYGADLTINYSISGIEYEVTVSSTSAAVTTEPAAGTTEYVFQGDNQDIILYTDYFDDITVTDNSTNIKNSFTRYTARTEEITVVPSELAASSGTVTNASNGLTGTSSDTSARVTGSGGYMAYAFDLSAIPSDAADISVSCAVKAQTYRSSSSSYTYCYAQLYTGSTAKGSSVGFANSAPVISNLSTGTWSREELDSLLLRISYTYTGSSTYYAWFFGADLTVSYQVDGVYYKYTISNIAADHTIAIADVPGTFYNVTATSSYAGATVSPATQSIKEGRAATVDISVNDIHEIVVKDNGTNVTSSLVETSTGCTYTISSVTAAHAITVEEASYYSITGTSSFSGASFDNLPKKIYVAGSNFTVSLNASNSYSYKLFDNSVDVTDSVTRSGTAVCIPSAYLNGTSEPTNPSNALHDTTNTTMAEHRLASNAYWEYRIDTSGIPDGVAIASVSCSVKGYGTRTSGSSSTVQLYSGNTAKGSAETLPTEEGEVFDITNTGTWTRAELANCILRITSTYTGSNTYYANIYGAEVTVVYEGNNYTVENIRENHTLSIVEQDKYSVSASSSYASATVSVNPSTVYKGDSYTVTLRVSDISLVSVSVNGTMITGMFTGSSGTYTCVISDVQEAQTVLVTEKIMYNITVTNQSTNGEIVPVGNIAVEAGYDKIFKIITDDISTLLLQCDNELVNNDIVYCEYVSSSSEIIPSGFDASNSSYNGMYNNTSISSGYISSSNTSSYAGFLANTGENAQSNIFYTFNCSSIPEDAIIDSVTCSIKGRVSNTTYLTSAYAQLYSGSTAKGSQSDSFLSTSTVLRTITNTGTWTRSELDNIKIGAFFARGTSNVTSSAHFRFYGATLTVNYHVDAHYTYEVKLVSDNHNLNLRDWPDQLIYVKNGNRFILPLKIFKKISNAWVEQLNPDNLIDPSKIYINK